MTLFKLSITQKSFLIKNLFNLAISPKDRRYYKPTHVMYYADKHIPSAGILFLKKNKNGIEFKFTENALDGDLLPVDVTNNMIAYMDSKSFTMIPNDIYNIIKQLVSTGYKAW